MHRPLLHALMAAALAFATVSADANDSTARVGAGGIVLLKSSNVRMLHETLEISTKTVRVRYRFLNESSKDIATTVAFPFPAYGWDPESRNNGSLESFKLRVDGEPQSVQTRRGVIADDEDVTERLRRIGLSEEQMFRLGYGDPENPPELKLTKVQSETMARIGLYSWQVQDTAFWKQVFPSRKEIEVEHEYLPYVGRTFGIWYRNNNRHENDLPAGSWSKDREEACLDEGARQAISRRIQVLAAQGANSVLVVLHDVEYVLGTGRNWKGPVVDFKLRIEKETPDQIVSLCFPGKPKKISPLILEFSHSNFVPQDTLVVYFYTVEAVK